MGRRSCYGLPPANRVWIINCEWPLKIDYEPGDICVLRISGILKQSEFAAEQGALSRRIDTGSKPRLLVILENFDGWNVARIGMISIS